MVYYSSGELCLENSVFQTGYCLAKRLSGFDKLGKKYSINFSQKVNIAGGHTRVLKEKNIILIKCTKYTKPENNNELKNKREKFH